jgi:hypothetical protein
MTEMILLVKTENAEKMNRKILKIEVLVIHREDESKNSKDRSS